MTARFIVFGLIFLFAANTMADDNCDNCKRLVEAKYLVCFKKAKTEAAKKECDDAKDKQKKVCQVSQCMKGLF